MGSMLRFELQRARSVRITWVLLGVIAFLTTAAAMGSFFSITNGPPEPGADPVAAARDLAGIITGTAPFIAVLQAVLGAQSLDHEYRYGTIRLTAQAFPNRTRLLVGKAQAVFLMVGGFTLAVYAAAVVLGAVLEGQIDDLGQFGLWRVVLSGAVVGGLWAVIGLGLRVVLGNIAVLAVLVALVPLILENMVLLPLLGKAGLSDDTLDRIAPFLLSGSSFRAISWSADEGPSPLVALVAFAGWAVLFLVVANVLFTRRDIRPA